MFLSPLNGPSNVGASEEEVSVIVNANDGVSSDTVEQVLENNNVIEVSSLASGFVSARVSQNCIRALEAFAQVEILHEQKML